jgi:UTP-glucose-1-phosphate uridylyltransferase
VVICLPFVYGRVHIHFVVTFHEYRDQIYEQYRYLQQLFHSDEEAYTEACKVVVDFCNSQLVTQGEFDGSTQAVVAHMETAKDQFTNLVCPDLLVLSDV